MSQQLQEAVQILEELSRREHFKALERFEPYPLQLDWLNDKKPINTLWGGNQVGKSLCAAIAIAFHARGEYPDWWKGKRHHKPVDIWVVGLTNESTRDTCQKKLIGPDLDHPGFDGLIHPDWIQGSVTRRAGVSGAADTVRVKHISGGVSTITFKSAEMGREKLQGSTLDYIWMDEEPERDVFDELLMRLIARKGQMLLTFTPLKGMSDVCLFLIEDTSGMVNRITISWSDVKHLDEGSKEMMRKMYSKSPGQFAARSTGIPTIASGLVYPFQEDEMFVRRFPMEKFWPRLGAIDVGWDHPTAALVAAMDPDAQVIYVYGEYKKSQEPVSTHAASILKWGDIDYAMDPASLQSDKANGEKLMHLYLDEFHRGADWKDINESERRIFKADNAVLAGINEVYEWLEQGKLFFMEDLNEIRKEIKLYRWDEKKPGRPVKKLDDLMDVLRYLIRSRSKFRVMGQRRFDLSGITIEQWKPPTRGY